ncbi:hypothetical protein [Nocardia sp. NPDC060249]|uniref:hypothetical protein n=1 Tax=Nocardia sp. NPDC060249 TaxID=3347082 RepID=UPI00365D24FB
MTSQRLPIEAETFLAARIGDDLRTAITNRSEELGDRMIGEALAKNALLTLYRQARKETDEARLKADNRVTIDSLTIAVAVGERENALRTALCVLLDIYHQHPEFDRDWIEPLLPLLPARRAWISGIPGN